MKRLIGTSLLILCTASPAMVARADDKDPHAILDRAIKAMGGEEKLKKAEAFSWKAKGTFNFNGNENEYTSHSVAKGADHFRRETEIDTENGARTFVLVMAGDRGWMKFGEEPREIPEEGLPNWKRMGYLDFLPATLVPLKGKDYTLESAGEKKVNDKPAVGIKVTGPDKKDFTLYFDKESGLPVQVVAEVSGFRGNEFTQETSYSDYKEFGGIKKATKHVSTRDGEPFVTTEITEFKILDKVDDKTFSEPE